MSPGLVATLEREMADAWAACKREYGPRRREYLVGRYHGLRDALRFVVRQLELAPSLVGVA